MSGGPLAGLEGVRVVDRSEDLAGAYCTKLLGDAGATVVKAEPAGGSALRRRTQTGTLGADGDPDGALWRFLAAGHASVDAGSPELAGFEPHVVVMGPAADPVTFSAANPSVVVVCHSGFGLTGPRAGESRPELLLQALSGGLMTHGRPDGLPLMVGGSLADWAVGLYGALGAVTALCSGGGALVDVSTLEVMAITLANYPTIQASLPGWDRKRSTFLMVPGIEPCADGYVGIATITAEQWHTFLAMIGRADLAADDTLLVQPRRVERPDVIDAIQGWTRRHTVAEVVELATLHRIPVVPIGNGRTLPDNEQVRARALFDPNPRGGFPHPRPAFRSSATDPRPPREAPAPGAGLPRRPGHSGAALRFATLSGVRVLDLTAFLAGPFGTHYLASAGADVIKVESIQRPDPMRFNVRVPPTVDRWYDQGNIYLAVNLNKRAITLNLTDPRGRDLLLRLAATCDVVIENFTPRVLEQFDLTYDRFREVRPDVIMVRMPGFGLDGPWRDRPGFAASMEQVSGLAWVTGYRDGTPNIPGACDPVAGAHAAFAVITALAHRARTGEGQHVELAMLDMASNLVAEQVVEYHAYGHLMTCEENRSRSAAPQGTYVCSDGEWVALAVGSDASWMSLCALLGWDPPSSMATLAGRQAAHDAIDDRVAAWCAARTHEETLGALSGAGVPAEPVVNAFDADKDEQMNSRGFWEAVEHPLVGELRYPAWPMRMTPGPERWYRTPAPLLAQHNDEVLGALGVTPSELASLREAGVIGDRLP